MTPTRSPRATALAVVPLLALAATLAACGSDDPVNHPWRPGGAPAGSAPAPSEGSTLTGTVAGAGASSQESAMQAWIAGFQSLHPGTTVAYDPVGSGGGRTQFLDGGIDFGGSDAPLDDAELARAEERCGPGGVVEVPLYVSPIAVVFNLDGIERLDMSPATVAGIFNRTITQWDDPAIAAENPGVALPDLRITPVNRSDESGTTENFTEYLHAAAPEAWPHEPSGDWPLDGGQSAQGTSAVIQTVLDGRGTIAYADASKAGTLGTVAVRVGEEFVPFSPEAAAAVVDVSPRAAGRPDGSVVVELDRTPDEAGVYPIVLVAYTIACRDYDDPATGEVVGSFLRYVVSEAGQAVAADAAGAAPVSDRLRDELAPLLESIG